MSYADGTPSNESIYQLALLVYPDWLRERNVRMVTTQGIVTGNKHRRECIPNTCELKFSKQLLSKAPFNISERQNLQNENCSKV